MFCCLPQKCTTGIPQTCPECFYTTLYINQTEKIPCFYSAAASFPINQPRYPLSSSFLFIPLLSHWDGTPTALFCQQPEPSLLSQIECVPFIPHYIEVCKSDHGMILLTFTSQEGSCFLCPDSWYWFTNGVGCQHNPLDLVGLSIGIAA